MKKHKIVLSAENCFLYEKCQEAWWPAIDTHASVVTVKKGQLIFDEGAPVEGIYFMVEGVCKVHKKWGDDKELIIRFALAKDIVGHRGLSTYADVYPVSATALTDVTVCYIDLAFFEATLKVNTTFTHEILMFFADELRLSEQNLQVLVHLNVKGRLARLLLRLEQKFGIGEEGYIGFPITRQDLAACIGTAYETVYRLLVEFTEEKVIQTKGKSIALLDKQVLVSLAGEYA